MNDPDTKAWERTTPLYGFSSPLPDYNVSYLLPKLVLSTYYSTPAAQVRSMRTLSIEGRKLSQMISASRKFYSLKLTKMVFSFRTCILLCS